jgi:hypothetical protein
MANFLTFGDLISQVELAVKQYQSSMGGLVRSVINQVYLSEILQCDVFHPLHWLQFPIHYKLHASKAITAISQAATCQITSSSHGFRGGEVIAVWNVEGMTEVNFDYNVGYGNRQHFYVVDTAGIAANTFTITDLNGIDIDSTAFTAYTSGGIILHHGWAITDQNIQKVTKVGIQNGLPLDPIDWDTLLENPDDYVSANSGQPDNFLHMQFFTTAGIEYNYLLTFPGCQEAKLVYPLVVIEAQRLSAVTDVPLLPPQFHDTIIAGAITRLAENKVEVENAVVWPRIYNAQIEALKDYNRAWYERHKTDKKPYLL